MLYDPKWAKPSLAGFISWLEKQDPKARFDYVPPDNCAIGQYLKSIGTTYEDYYCDGGGMGNLCDWNQNVTAKTKTLGGALKAARAYAKQIGEA
jgi:hypothetical protein